MLKRLKFFARSDSGAVTTDFLVLTAIIVSMASLSLSAITNRTNAAALATANGIETMDDEL